MRYVIGYPSNEESLVYGLDDDEGNQQAMEPFTSLQLARQYHCDFTGNPKIFKLVQVYPKPKK